MPASWSQEAYRAALLFAAERHQVLQDQKLPGGELPYLVHVVLVATEVVAALREEQLARPDLAVQCALLHDVVEDTPTGLDELRARFGDEVAAGVDALSKREAAGDKTAQIADSLQRIREQPREVWIVKLADRIANLGPPPASWDAAKRRRYQRDAVLIRDALAAASPRLAARLSQKIAEYAQYIAD